MSSVLLIFVATLGLGIRFSLPKAPMALSSVVAASSFFTVMELKSLGASESEAAFAGALLVAISSEILARLMRTPSPLISIPGIIPLVPGNRAFQALSHVVTSDELRGFKDGVSVLLTASAIASALLLVSALARKVLPPVFGTSD